MSQSRMEEFGEENNPYQSSAMQPHREPILEYELGELIASMARWQSYLSLLGISVSLLTFLALVPTFFWGAFSGFVMSVFLIFFLLIPSIVLFRVASVARAYSRNNYESLQQVVMAQRGFWRFVGVTATIVIGFYALILSAIFVAAIARR